MRSRRVWAKRKIEAFFIPLAALFIAAGLFFACAGRPFPAGGSITHEASAFDFIGEIAELVSPAVVSVESVHAVSSEMLQVGSGSGFIFSPDGYIITNYHVIGGAEGITVSLADGRQAPAALIASYPENDLALLRIDLPDLPTVELGDSNAVQVGNIVFAIGNPGGAQFARSLTMGVISGRERQLTLTDGNEYTLLQTDAAINPGNSGGPLVDCFGRVIGVTSVKIVDKEFEGMGFAIPINTVRDVLQVEEPQLFSTAETEKNK